MGIAADHVPSQSVYCCFYSFSDESNMAASSYRGACWVIGYCSPVRGL